jgi:hypothetical protein
MNDVSRAVETLADWCRFYGKRRALLCLLNYLNLKVLIYNGACYIDLRKFANPEANCIPLMMQQELGATAGAPHFLPEKKRDCRTLFLLLPLSKRRRLFAPQNCTSLVLRPGF